MKGSPLFIAVALSSPPGHGLGQPQARPCGRVRVGRDPVGNVCSGLHRRRPVGHSRPLPSEPHRPAAVARPWAGTRPRGEVRRLIPRSSRSCAVFVRILSRWASGSVMHAKCPLRAPVRLMMPSGL